MKVHFTKILIIGISVSTATAQYEIITQNAPIVYETKAEIPTPREVIAAAMSSDFNRLQDEFSKNDYLQKLNPVIDKKIAEAKSLKDFDVIVSQNLAPYNFEHNGFPTDVSDNTFIPLGNYAVRFSNFQNCAFIKIPLENAKELSMTLRRSRDAKIAYIGTLEKVTEENLNGYNQVKVIYLKVNQIRLSLPTGQSFTSTVD